MNYTQKDLVRIAQRENNTKRGYLVVDPMQGKHMAISPARALELFTALAAKLKGKYSGEHILVAGFAETATAIGAQAAITLGSDYIQTTREPIEGVNYLFFSEAHSHATEQKLVKDDIDRAISGVDRIIFAEDEVTTGNTIMNIIRLLNATYKKEIRYTILSLLNGMGKDSIERCENEKIDLCYLVKTDHSTYEDIAARYTADGDYIQPDSTPCSGYQTLQVPGWMNARRLVSAKAYEEACEAMTRDLLPRLGVSAGQSVLVIGTEEFMFPALYLGRKLEELGCTVRSHSTTRSPIAVSRDPDYPLHIRWELRSLYDENRRTFIYDIQKYDKVLILTDAPAMPAASLNTLLHGVKQNNSDVTIVRWY